MCVICYYTHSIRLFNLFRYLKVNHYKNIIKINNALNLNLIKDKKSVIKKITWRFSVEVLFKLLKLCRQEKWLFSSCQYCCLMHFIYTAELIIYLWTEKWRTAGLLSATVYIHSSVHFIIIKEGFPYTSMYANTVSCIHCWCHTLISASEHTPSCSEVVSALLWRCSGTDVSEQQMCNMFPAVSMDQAADRPAWSKRNMLSDYYTLTQTSRLNAVCHTHRLHSSLQPPFWHNR